IYGHTKLDPKGTVDNDVIDGGPGNDSVLAGGDGNDLVMGGDGNDQLGIAFDTAGRAIAGSEAGDDKLIGSGNGIVENAGTGDDLIWNDAGMDLLSGGGGNDTSNYDLGPPFAKDTYADGFSFYLVVIGGGFDTIYPGDKIAESV